MWYLQITNWDEHPSKEKKCMPNRVKSPSSPPKKNQAIEVLLAARAFVVKKTGNVSDDSMGTPQTGQCTWSKYKGPTTAWQTAKAWAHFI